MAQCIGFEGSFAGSFFAEQGSDTLRSVIDYGPAFTARIGSDLEPALPVDKCRTDAAEADHRDLVLLGLAQFFGEAITPIRTTFGAGVVLLHHLTKPPQQGRRGIGYRIPR